MRHHYLDALGGAEVQAHLIARVLQDHGHVVRYMALRGNAEAQKPSVTIDSSGVEVVRLPRAGVDSSVEAMLRRELESFAPDVCYTRTFSDVAVILRTCGRVSVPCIYHVSRDDQCSALPLWVTWRSYRPRHVAAHVAAYRAVKRSASLVVCQTEDQRRRLVGHDRSFGARTRVVAKLWPEPEKKDAGGDSVIWIANLKRTKRPALFLRLARDLKAEGTLDFVMIGQASGGRLDREVARSVASGDLRYLGPLSLNDAEAQLHQAALLVNTSKVEGGFPITFLQAFALGVPVISLTVDPDGILNGTGLGLRSGTYKQMKDDVRRVMGDPALAASMAECGRRYFAANHALGKVGPSYVRLFEEAVGLASAAAAGGDGV